MRVAVVAVDGVFDSGLSVVLDVLSTANSMRENLVVAPPAFDITIAGLSSQARTGHGLRVETVQLTAITARPELVILPALSAKSAEQIVTAVRGHPLLGWLRQVRAAGVRVAAACTGTFLLAESGVLDGSTATTSWWLGPAFRRRYPAVRLDDASTVVVDGTITTAGAAFAHIDLAVSIVRQHSPALSELTSRFLMAGERQSQFACAMPTLLAESDPMIAAFERWVRNHLDEAVRVSDIAQAVGVSERTLQRATMRVLGMSPLKFVQRIRLDQATYLLQTSSRSVNSVAAAVGYQNVGSLRRLVRRETHSSLGAIRSR
ncbi:helix-turn-helix domain-containing protein [Mycobacterium sp. SM1]|uniref:GlxA family transcriptional regulator n=1 Tax=Mycobacterium sp. SM1 TaxID=2816243 RepID=UPI001BCD0F2D|nr:helix-turn-helix domain-containing protein [Mycobacterium sp. SM1]MBS4728295.1 helix-turn-helix domain-containing protein [Mycobacterium sp. SM1]